MAIARSILFLFVLVILPLALSADEKSVRASSPIWRDALPTEADTELDRLSRAFVQLAANVRPAIVQIRVMGFHEAKSASSPEQLQNSRGSGFIIDPQGYILTAHHVVDKAKEIEVRLADSQRLPAQVIAADSRVDMAILKISSERLLPALSLGDSDRIHVGDLAVVIGYPFGRESSMNLGIISRSGRSFPGSASYDFIQTDAGAYPGGSGGPLLSSKGHVIGMITMASERGNMGFATPINVVKRMIPRLMGGEKLVWGWLGVQMAELSLEQAKLLGLLPAKGAVVRLVLPDQAAARGGILKQDIILSVNDTQIDSPRDVLRMIGGLEAGKVVKLTILRKGKTIQLSVPLGSKPESVTEQQG